MYVSSTSATTRLSEGCMRLIRYDISRTVENVFYTLVVKVLEGGRKEQEDERKR